MPRLLSTVMLYVLLPVVATIVGGVGATFRLVDDIRQLLKRG